MVTALHPPKSHRHSPPLVRTCPPPASVQRQAKKVLAVAVHNHYKRIEHEMEAQRLQSPQAAQAAQQGGVVDSGSGEPVKGMSLQVGAGDAGAVGQARPPVPQHGDRQGREGGREGVEPPNAVLPTRAPCRQLCLVEQGLARHQPQAHTAATDTRPAICHPPASAGHAPRAAAPVWAGRAGTQPH